MTDLEKLAAEVAARIHKNMERRFGYEADFENDKDTAAYIHDTLIVARLQGRIEGLEEAAGLAARVFSFYRKYFPPGNDEAKACQDIRHDIRARIKELKGE